MTLRAMVLAAGRGERMRPLTDARPKPMLAVAGEPMIASQLARLSAAGVRHVVINIAYLGEQIRAFVGDGGRWGLEVIYSDEGATALETAGGIARVLPWLAPEDDSPPFLVLGADLLSDYPIERLVRQAVDMPACADAHLVLVDNPPHNRAGDFALLDGVVSNREQGRYTFSGMGLYRAGLFADVARWRDERGAAPLAPLLREAAGAGRVTGEHYGGYWMDVGTPERLAQARRDWPAVTSPRNP